MTTITNESEKQLADQPTVKPSLGINDLKACLQVIEICSQRGAFKAEELTGVGTLYQKVALFVQAAEATASEAASQAAANDTAAPQETTTNRKNKKQG